MSLGFKRITVQVYQTLNAISCLNRSFTFSYKILIYYKVFTN